MDFDKYKNNMPYPEKPKKPVLPTNATSAHVRQYADLLDGYENRMRAYSVERDEYAVENRRLHEMFKRDALDDVGLLNHPKADKAFSFAWEHGHSSGLSDVYYWLSEIADLMTE